VFGHGVFNFKNSCCNRLNMAIDPIELTGFVCVDFQSKFDDFALFFYDVFGGKYIGVVWKPSAFLPRSISVSILNLILYR